MASIKRIGKDKEGRTVWDVVYRRTAGGKQIHRRIHAAAKIDVERQIALDSGRGDISLKWSEGLAVYVAAKHSEKRNPVGIGHAERAVSVFIQTIGDIAIENTTPEVMQRFMQHVANGTTVRDVNDKAYVTAGPGVANHHRKELITIARYLLRYAGKISTIPFDNVPELPVRITRRSPIPEPDVPRYLDALQPHVRRPVLLVLFYGLRSTAICNLTPASVRPGYLVAVDKGNVERRIPIDSMLDEIIRDAVAHRETFPAPANRLFVNKAGRAWNRMTFLHAAQRQWKAAGLEKKRIHEVRHTLGTLAGKNFSPGMVQAAMGHQSRMALK